MLAPPGGVTRSSTGGAGNVVYGVLTDLYQLEGRFTAGAAFNSLVESLVRDNPGLTPSQASDFSAAGVAGRTVECDNPSANGGKGEHDWIVGFPVGNSALRYFVFIAPKPDFEKLRPMFTKIAQSISLR